jgi:RimJ/RimL family protein N-acetyltransferase
VDNPGSARVMEKCGMSFEGILKRWLRRPSADEPVDCLCHAVTK